MLSQQIGHVILDLVYIVVGLAVYEAKKYLYAHTTKAQRREIEAVAGVVVPYVEKQFPALNGTAKMEQALSLASNWLEKKGIKVSRSQLQAEVQSAYNDAVQFKNLKKEVTPVADPTKAS